MEKLTFNKKEFKEAMEVLFAVSKEEYRPILKCVNFNNNEVVALDGYRLSLRKISQSLEGNYNVDGRFLKYVLKEKINSKTEKIELLFNDTIVSVFIDDIKTVESKLVQGSYISYKSLIPQNSNTTVLIDAKELKESIRPLKKNNQVLINVKENSLSVKDIISLVNKEDHTDRKIILGSIVNKTFEIYKDGLDLEILFNHTYIKEAIKNYSNKEKLTINFIDNLSGVVITDCKNRIDLVLPLRKVWGNCEVVE